MNKVSAKLSANMNKLDFQTQQILTSWSDHVISWVDRSRLPVYVIRFEDMLDDPRNAFGKAMVFLHWNMRNLKSSMQ